MRDLYIRRMTLIDLPPKESYLNRLPVVKYLAEKGIDFHKQVTFFVGENGSGKSTLIEALAINQGFNPEGGTKNFNFRTADTHSILHYHLRVVRGVIRPKTGFFLRAESFYNVASNVDELEIAEYYGGSLHRRSHGESFLALAECRFRGNGLYILDEPEAALSPRGIIQLMQRMNELVNENSQFIISTHSPMLMTFPNAEVYQIQKDGIASVRFQDTEHYRTTVRFLQNPESAMEDILGNTDVYCYRAHYYDEDQIKARQRRQEGYGK